MAMFGIVENQWQWQYNLYDRCCQSCHILIVVGIYSVGIRYVNNDFDYRTSIHFVDSVLYMYDSYTPQ